MSPRAYPAIARVGWALLVIGLALAVLVPLLSGCAEARLVTKCALDPRCDVR